jgi:hypothetical protein
MVIGGGFACVVQVTGEIPCNISGDGLTTRSSGPHLRLAAELGR